MMLDSTEDLKLETLTGDIRDAMIGHLRQMKRPWTLLTEDEQRGAYMAFESAAEHLVRQVVQMMTKHEFPHAVVNIGEVKIKGEKGIEAKIGCPNIEHNRNVMGDAVGTMAMLLMVDSETFFGQRKEPEVAPDQPVMPGM